MHSACAVWLAVDDRRPPGARVTGNWHHSGDRVGRGLYQRALTITDNNNGFVSVFFLLIPAFTCLLSLGMSPWIKELKFPVGPLFFLGLGLVAAPILVFLWQS